MVLGGPNLEPRECSIGSAFMCSPSWHDLVAVAMGGNAALTGDLDRPPVRCTLPTAYYHAGAEAALGVSMALVARESSGPVRIKSRDLLLQE